MPMAQHPIHVQGVKESTLHPLMKSTTLEATLSEKENTSMTYISTLFYLLKQINRYTIKANEWKLLSNSKDISPRVDHSMVLTGKTIYIFGGSDGKNKFDDLLNYEIVQNKWNKTKGDGDLPCARFGHTSEIYRNQMYIFGGWNGAETLDELFAYSFLSNYWYQERIVSGIKPPCRYRHASTVIGCSMYIFGGVDKNQTRYDDLYEFNFERREWK